ncbi:T9SS type A sorting domain-containing protein [Algibacter sp.]|nr:T9SS type A sorting domain-containing protein [Algibacter sp.]
MKKLITYLRIMVFLPFIFICSSQTMNAQGNGGGGNGGGGGGGGNGGGGHNGGGGGDGETGGNNLSFPVIFADGGSKVLPGTLEAYSLEGVWWYVWGEDPVDPEAPLYSCEPLDNNSGKCIDGTDPGDGTSEVYKAYIQKDLKNVWQAHNAPVPAGETLNVDWVDWGDNLESLAWKISSKLRTEIVLLQDIDSVTQFSMRHVDSWGIDEVHGLQTTLEDEPVYAAGTQATVFTPKARLTMQKLNYTSSSIDPSRLIWVPETGWTEAQAENADIINEPMFNQAVSEAGDGPAFFNAEINVKGKIMFGYTWDVGDMNEGEGYYRLTFSFDEGDEAIGTAKFDEFTQIIVAEEEDDEEDHKTAKTTEITEGGPGGGGIPVMDSSNNLTYIDVLIGEDVSEYLPWVAVTGLELIDAVNDVSLGSLTDGMWIDINEVPISNLSVEAIATSDVGSVKFELSGEHSTSSSENVAPYTLYGHTNGDYSGKDFTKGNYNLTVTPYAEDDLTGEIGTPITVSFEMVSAPPEGAGNNLSFPVIWADGGSKALRGTMGDYTINGEWWYVWGEDPIDPQATLYSCKPSDNNPNKCEDNSDPGDGVSEVYKAYIQKDADNTWQAYNASVPDNDTLYVNWVDWGDNLESLAWKINSKVRTEVVLVQDIDSVMQFSMRHVDSWGIDEVHGLQTTLDDEVVYGSGTQATVFTPKARLTMQKLNYKSGSFNPSRLSWLADEKKWTEANPEEEFDIINEPILNQAVFEAGDGSGYFNAEVNVKGKIMFGYTWDVGSKNEGEGHYRLTFSFDEGTEGIGTARFNELTQIIVPIEEESKTNKTQEAPSDGGIAIMDASNNLTYMDVLIGEAGIILGTKSTENSKVVPFKIYPNPTTGIINIKNTTGNLVNVFDVLGHKVFTAKLDGSSDSKTLDLSALQTGLYFVKISDGRNASVKKIIIK